METEQLVLEILKLGIGTLIAGIAACIAYQQFQVARTKLRLDLYEKRFKVFTALKEFMLKVMQKADVDIDDFRRLYAEIAEAEFLFGPEVVKYITEVKRKAADLGVLQDKLHRQHLPVGPERTKAAADDADILRWLDMQLEEAPKIFKPYLDFTTIRG